MSRIDIFFTVSGQCITQDIDNPTLHAGDKGYFYAVFDLEDAFLDIEPKAVFTKQGGSVVMDLVKNAADKYECAIPWEAMYTSGFFTVGIFGGDMMLTNAVSVKVEKGCVPEGGKPLEPTPGWSDKINAEITAINKELENKVTKEEGKGLSTNDYTDEDKEKVKSFNGGGGGDVSSVAGKKGDVILSKEDVGLDKVDNTSDIEKPISALTKEALNALEKTVKDTKDSIPKKTSDLVNDSDFATNKEVEAALPKKTSDLTNDSDFITAGETDRKVSEHNTNIESHNDLRLSIKEVADRLNAFLNTDDTTLDELSEIVEYITNNKDLIDNITTSKVSVADIIDNLTTNVSNKPLSAKQGVALKTLIDTLTGDLSLIDMSRPYIGENGHWYEWDNDLKKFVDSGVLAKGTSVTHSWDGTTLIITSANGTSSADLKGEQGVSGVYVGSGEMPEGYDVQIDPNGEAFDIEAYIEEILLGGAW